MGDEPSRGVKKGEDTDTVRSIPLDTEDGGQVVIEQQNVGPDNQVGGGEFKEPGTAALHKSPEQAAREQRELDDDRTAEPD